MNHHFLLSCKLFIVGLISLSNLAASPIAQGSSPLEDALIRQRDRTNERLRQSQEAITQPSPSPQNVTEADLERLKQEGLALLKQNQYKLAQQKFIEAYNLGAQDASVDYYIGLTSYHLGENTRAVKAFTSALKKNPSSIDSRYYRGRAYSNLNNNQAAFSDYTYILNKDSKHCAAWNSRGVINLIQEKYNEAIYDFNQALNLSPDSLCEQYVVLYNLGDTHLTLKKYQTAINYLNQAIRLKPDYADAWNLRGVAYSWLNNFPQAIVDYQKALEINPNHQDALRNLAIATTPSQPNSLNSGISYPSDLDYPTSSPVEDQPLDPWDTCGASYCSSWD